MNFSDFGIKDESELEQDEFSLSRPQFGKDNQLTVIGWKNKPGTAKYYIVKCSECSKDPELFGDGVFRIFKKNLKTGSVPCGCAFNPKWDEHQYKILIERKCKDRDYIFHGFAEDFKGNQTKLILECQNHGVWETGSISGFINYSKGCPKCKDIKVKIVNTKEDHYHINNFFSTGKFKEGTKFWRSVRTSPQGYRRFWNYTCPVCSNDEYVKNGLCSGVFEITRSNIAKGHKACRCSPSYRWTQQQYEYKIKKKMKESKTTDKFIGFISGFKNHKSILQRLCKIHGKYETSITGWLNLSHSCPLCANQNQQECYINLVKDSDFVVAIKFGIAKDSKHRIKNQNNKSVFEIEQYGVWSFPDVKSCKAAEKFIKQNLTCRLLTKQEMPDGYTETTSVENLEAIIKIYEDFGGVRKIIESENLLEDKSL